jgi:hypothetical protein
MKKIKRLIPGQVKRVGRVLAASVAIVLGFLSTADAEEVCHLMGGGAHFTIDVPLEDVADHLAHGDSLGSCYPPQNDVPYTCSSSTLFYNKLFVRVGATPPMKGTVDKPFSTVSAALEYAARKRLGAVEVQVAPGYYGQDSAEITRPTRIVGPGRDAASTAELALSIDHRSTHELGIQGVLFRPNGQEPGLTVRTDVMAYDPRGHTALCNIEYDQIVGHAVAQVGGSISADDIIVRNTRRHPDADFLNVLSGTAFIFGGGLGGSINSLLENSFVFDSESTGIVASGFRTTVTLNAVALSGGQGCFGGLYVSNAAEVLGSHIRIGGVRSPVDVYGIEGLDHVAGEPIVLTGNRQSGVYARGTTVLAGNDTFVGIYDLIVRNTSSSDNDSEECGFDSATSLGVDRGADITVDQFILDASALLGVRIDATGSIIFGEWFGSTINLSNGIVTNNPVGANIQNPDYDMSTLQDNVLWFDNDVNLDVEILVIPEPEQDLDSL